MKNHHESSLLASNVTGNNSSHLHGTAPQLNRIYVFTPVDDTSKWALCALFSTIGCLGFFGNCLLLYFLWKKPKANPIQRSTFMRNLNLYVRSMSVSDILSCAVSLPPTCIQILFDVFQSGWPCKLVRYLSFIFPAITVNNLVVISLEKHLSTRANPRTFSAATVQKMIIFAWVFGIFFMLLPAAAYDGIRVDLNDTHFTVDCRNDRNFYPFKILLVVFPVQYLLPGIFITYINICLIKTVWVRGSRSVGNGPPNNAFKAKMRTVRIKGVSLLIAITFTFIISYLFFLGYLIAYTLLSQPNRDFSTDYIIRYASGSIAYLNCVTDVIICFVQMKDFREFLRKRLGRSRSGNANSHINNKICLEKQTYACAQVAAQKRTVSVQRYVQNGVQ